MNIGKTELKHGLVLAPMAGFSDRAMRLVCRRYGAEYTVTEMVSAKAVTFGDKKTAAIARIGEDEGPVALQLFGSEPDVMAKATEIMSGGVAGFVSPVAIDINMGCPVNKIFSNGEGSALNARRRQRLAERLLSPYTAVPVLSYIRVELTARSLEM